MDKYRVEWQIGGEFRTHIKGNLSESEVRKIIENALEGIAEDVADDVSSDLEAITSHYDANPPSVTIFKYGPIKKEEDDVD